MGVFYRTTSQVFGYDINARLRDLLTELRNDRVLLMGDFNYPGVDWVVGDNRGASPEGVMFLECLEDNSLSAQLGDTIWLFRVRDWSHQSGRSPSLHQERGIACPLTLD